MKKIIGYIFLGLGTILIIVSIIVFTFNSKNDKDYESDNNIGYDYIKAHDNINKKKLTFPIIDKSLIKREGSNEFNIVYENNNIMIRANTYNIFGSIDDFILNEYNNYKIIAENSGYTLQSNNIACDYNCKNYKITDGDVVKLDVFRIYQEISDNEIALIIYQQKDKEIPSDLINEILSEIKITNDATYKIGTVSKDKLIIKLTSDGSNYYTYTFDDNMYEEITTSENTTNLTTILDKKNNNFITLKLLYKDENDAIKDKIGLYFSGLNETVVINKKDKYYECDIDGIVYYAIIIDDSNALVIEPSAKNTNININDFLNFKDEKK